MSHKVQGHSSNHKQNMNMFGQKLKQNCITSCRQMLRICYLDPLTTCYHCAYYKQPPSENES